MKTSLDIRTEYLFKGAFHLWPLFIVIAVALLISPYILEQGNTSVKTTIMGIVAFVSALCLRYSYQGVELDTASKRIRKYTAIIGIKVGEWVNLPDLKKLRFSLSRDTGVSISQNTVIKQTPAALYHVTLIPAVKSPEYVIRIANPEKAQEVAAALSDALHLDIENIASI